MAYYSNSTIKSQNKKSNVKNMFWRGANVISVGMDHRRTLGSHIEFSESEFMAAM